MYKYEELILPYIEGKYTINDKGQLNCCCPFHYDNQPSFSIDLEKGLYNCFSCGETGNITNFIAKMENVDTKKAWKMINQGEYSSSTYKLEDFAEEKRFQVAELKMWGLSNGYNCINIPYYDEDHNLVATRMRYNPKERTDKGKFAWKKGSKITLYGLNGLEHCTDDYIVLVEGESDTLTLWNYGIQAMGVPGALNWKKDYAQKLEKFNKIYLHNEGDQGGQAFIERACKILPYEKLYTITSKKVDSECKDPSALHIKGIFDFDKLLETAEKIDENYYNEVNSSPEVKIEDDEEQEELAEHVKIAQEVMKRIEIKYYRKDFYVYNNGVYRPNLNLIENIILDINQNLKQHFRKEIIEYIRIRKTEEGTEINEQYINFQNGMYDLINQRLVPHSPKYFTTCQIHANYIEDVDLITNSDIDKFFDDVTCHNESRKKTLFQMIGYSMTSRTDLAKAFILYRTYC